MINDLSKNSINGGGGGSKKHKTIRKNTYAFTMIELIFVIVILGILASVAVPRFVASRNDAKIAKLQQDVANIKRAVPAFFIAKGNLSITKAVPLDEGIWDTYQEGRMVYYPKKKQKGLTLKFDNIKHASKPCIVIGFSNATASEFKLIAWNAPIPKNPLLVAYINKKSKMKLCPQIIKSALFQSTNISLGGSSISY